MLRCLSFHRMSSDINRPMGTSSSKCICRTFSHAYSVERPLMYRAERRSSRCCRNRHDAHLAVHPICSMVRCLAMRVNKSWPMNGFRPFFLGVLPILPVFGSSLNFSNVEGMLLPLTSATLTIQAHFLLSFSTMSFCVPSNLPSTRAANFSVTSFIAS